MVFTVLLSPYTGREVKIQISPIICDDLQSLLHIMLQTLMLINAISIGEESNVI